MADWAALHRDLLAHIAKRINTIEDFVAFGAVCTSWHSAAVKQNLNVSIKFPWLMLEDDRGNKDTREFFSLTKGKIYKLSLPNVYGKLCFASEGWILVFEGKAQIFLMSFLFGFIKIALPRKMVDKNGNFFKLNVVHRIALSTSPNTVSSDFMVMVVGGRREQDKDLIFWENGKSEWTKIDLGSDKVPCFDVEFYNGKFYAVNSKGVLVFDSNLRKMEFVVSKIPVKQSLFLDQGRFFVGVWPVPNHLLHLVDSSGKLLIVWQKITVKQLKNVWGGWGTPEVAKTGNGFCWYGTNATFAFEVFEVNLEDREFKEVKDLGNDALFLSDSSCLSVEAITGSMCKANFIYFAENSTRALVHGYWCLQHG